ncbi:MAG: DUF1499 domain-containing protein [Proteobacteria bacterium]|jgi:uncharacterized protein (DUF1499 family)|nr:DUF1499 domain-containing protein [Pseudomonadota bacterium]
MKTIGYLLVAVVVVAGIYLVLLSVQSRRIPPTVGLSGGHLRPCPATPNCVSSQTQNESAHVRPLEYSGSPEVAWRKLQHTVQHLGGRVVTLQKNYLHATFVTSLFRFVDDVEFLLDEQAGVIQVKSSSRVGRSDLGTNRKRIETIRTSYNGVTEQKE